MAVGLAAAFWPIALFGLYAVVLMRGTGAIFGPGRADRPRGRDADHRRHRAIRRRAGRSPRAATHDHPRHGAGADAGRWPGGARRGVLAAASMAVGSKGCPTWQWGRCSSAEIGACAGGRRWPRSSASASGSADGADPVRRADRSGPLGHHRLRCPVAAVAHARGRRARPDPGLRRPRPEAGASAARFAAVAGLGLAVVAGLRGSVSRLPRGALHGMTALCESTGC